MNFGYAAIGSLFISLVVLVISVLISLLSKSIGPVSYGVVTSLVVWLAYAIWILVDSIVLLIQLFY